MSVAQGMPGTDLRLRDYRWHVCGIFVLSNLHPIPEKSKWGTLTGLPLLKKNINSWHCEYHLAVFTIVTILVFSLATLSTFTLLCYYQQHLPTEIFSSCKAETLYPSSNNPSLPHTPPTTVPLSVSLNLTTLGTSCKWDPIGFVFYWLACFL